MTLLTDRASYWRQSHRPLPPSPAILREIGLDLGWVEQQQRYRAYEDWYDGMFFYEHSEEFPVGYNPLRIQCLMHMAAVIGQVTETADPTVKTLFVSDEAESATGEKKKTDEVSRQRGKKRDKTLGKLVNGVLYGSQSRALIPDAVLTSQKLGGAVLSIAYDPTNPFLAIPMRVEEIPPAEFFPIYTPSDPWHLLGAYVIRYIPAAVAQLQWGVKTSHPHAEYVEYWSRNERWITINGETAYYMMPDGSMGDPIEGPNPFYIEGFGGIVPYVYVPHIREGDFYGVPVMHQMEGTLEELNGRIADIGDAVHGGAHREHWVRNIAGDASLKRRKVGGVEATDLGQTPPGISHAPEIGVTDAPEVPQHAMEHVSKLQEWIDHTGFTPPVAQGKDEGSQRSALTLAMRMWPLTSHAEQERRYWTEALNVLAEYAVRIAYAKRDHPALAEYAITPDDFNRRKQQAWAPMLPRDVEAEANLAILEHQEGLKSTKTAIEELGSVDDVDEELGLIEEEEDKQMKAEQKQAMSDTKPPVAAVEGRD